MKNISVVGAEGQVVITIKDHAVVMPTYVATEFAQDILNVVEKINKEKPQSEICAQSWE